MQDATRKQSLWILSSCDEPANTKRQGLLISLEMQKGNTHTFSTHLGELFSYCSVAVVGERRRQQHVVLRVGKRYRFGTAKGETLINVSNKKRMWLGTGTTIISILELPILEVGSKDLLEEAGRAWGGGLPFKVSGKCFEVSKSRMKRW